MRDHSWSQAGAALQLRVVPRKERPTLSQCARSTSATLGAPWKVAVSASGRVRSRPELWPTTAPHAWLGGRAACDAVLGASCDGAVTAPVAVTKLVYSSASRALMSDARASASASRFWAVSGAPTEAAAVRASRSSASASSTSCRLGAPGGDPAALMYASQAAHAASQEEGWCGCSAASALDVCGSLAAWALFSWISLAACAGATLRS